MKPLWTIVLGTLLSLTWANASAQAPWSVVSDDASLLTMSGADLRLVGALRDSNGRLLVLHTVRSPGALATEGQLAILDVASEHRVTLDLGDGQQRHPGYYTTPWVASGDELAIAVRTREGLALARADAASLAILEVTHHAGDLQPLYLDATEAGVYRLVTSNGVWRWQAGEPLKRLVDPGPDVVVTAAAPAGPSLVLFGLKAGGQSVRGRLGDDAHLQWSEVETDTPPPAGRAVLGLGDEVIVSRFESDGRAVHLESYGESSRAGARHSVDLPLKIGPTGGIGAVSNDQHLLLVGGQRGDWLAFEVDDDGARQVLHHSEPEQSRRVQFSADLQAVPGARPDETTVLSTFATASRQAGRVVHGIRVQTLAHATGEP